MHRYVALLTAASLNPSPSLDVVQYFEHVEEAEWATEVAARTGLPVVTSLCIGPEGDMHGVSAAECAVRLAKAGVLRFHYPVGALWLCSLYCTLCRNRLVQYEFHSLATTFIEVKGEVASNRTLSVI